MELTKKKLKPAESISFQLKHAREEHHLSIPEVADRLKMSKEHIELIESGDYSRLPFALIYQKKLLGNYAELVDLNKETLLQQFQVEQCPAVNLPQIKFRRLHEKKFTLPFVLRIGAISLSTFVLLGYFVFQIKQIVKPPELTLVAPLDGLVTKDESIEVKGKTESEVRVMINGKEVKHGEQGDFQEPLTLAPGVNTIVISATSKHGKTATLTRYVVAQKDTQFSLGASTVSQN